jgi:hypothetical protein
LLHSVHIPSRFILSTLKMEAIYCSETSVLTRTTPLHTAEKAILNVSISEEWCLLGCYAVWSSGDVQWLRLAASKVSNIVNLFHHLKMERDSGFEVLCSVDIWNSVWRTKSIHPVMSVVQHRTKLLVPAKNNSLKIWISLIGQNHFNVSCCFCLKNAVVCDATPCGSCKNRRFRVTYRLHYQSDKNRRARNNVSNN